MPAVSDQIRFLLYAIGTISTLVFGYIASKVGKNILQLFFKTFHIPYQDDIPQKKPAIIWILWGMTLIGSVVGLGLAQTAPKRELNSNVMSGDYRVAVISFSVASKDLNDELGKEIATDTYEHLSLYLDDKESDLVISVWGPGDVIAGNEIVKEGDATKRAAIAVELAEEINADLIVYGVINKQTDGIIITPEYYVRSRNFYQAEEILGQYDLGTPILIRSYSDVADRVKFTEAMQTRSQALSQIILGLSYYSIQDYKQAQQEFQVAEKLEGWQANEGKQVLYLLLANSAIRQDDLDLAESYFRKSLEIDETYARPLVGLGNIYYRRALLQFAETEIPTEIDLNHMETARKYLNRALASSNQPPLSDIPVKVYFELGQINQMLRYGGFIDSYEPALVNFYKVIEVYSDGANPRIQERAAESHARIGLIHSLEGEIKEAIKEYQVAVDLLEEYPERQKLFKERIEKLSNIEGEN